MRTNIKLFCAAMILAGTVFTWAQEKNISGQVTDSNGFPVSEAYVYVEGTENGVYTDANGNYSLSVNEGDTVAVEFIGFETKTIDVSDANNYDVKLTQGGAIELQRTVVTALGIERDEKALGYSSQEIEGDMISGSGQNNAVSALSGNVAGVQVVAPSSMGGSSRITIRGVNSVLGNNKPLIVIDGVPLDNSN
ncbi:MAG: carboxypeptidase-like regulatory domain-containing protein, partial [Weeksellaceae bacterium]